MFLLDMVSDLSQKKRYGNKAMGRIYALFIMLFAVFGCVFCVAQESEILGLWYGPSDSDGRSAVIHFYRCGDLYSAYAVGYRSQGGKNKMESETIKHARAFMLGEITYLYDLKFDKNEWKDGKIHNPVGETDFNIRVKLSDDAQTAFLRVSLDRYGILGISTEWKRIPPEEEKNYFLLSDSELEKLHMKGN